MLVPISPRASLVDVTSDTLPALIELHKIIFPVTYGVKFFEYVLNSGDLAKLSNEAWGLGMTPDLMMFHCVSLLR